MMFAPVVNYAFKMVLLLQRKLSTPEYKNVDEEHRIAMIKHETTQMAVRDIEKYYSALDKVSNFRSVWLFFFVLVSSV